MHRRTLVALLTSAFCSVVATSITPALAQEATEKEVATVNGIGAAELADRVQAFYDKTKTFKATFKQRYWIDAYRKSVDSNLASCLQGVGGSRDSLAHRAREVGRDKADLVVVREQLAGLLEGSESSARLRSSGESGEV